LLVLRICLLKQLLFRDKGLTVLLEVAGRSVHLVEFIGLLRGLLRYKHVSLEGLYALGPVLLLVNLFVSVTGLVHSLELRLLLGKVFESIVLEVLSEHKLAGDLVPIEFESVEVFEG
jgi:hypothetical protein